MTSSQATCMLCLSSNKNTINFYSDQGKELNILSILSTHFWFRVSEGEINSINASHSLNWNIIILARRYKSFVTEHLLRMLAKN